MSVPGGLPVDLLLVVGLLGLGTAAVRYTPVTEVRRSLPSRLRTGVEAVALSGPWFLYFEGWLRVPGAPVGGFVVALACSLVLWLALPLVVAPFVERRPGGAC